MTGKGKGEGGKGGKGGKGDDDGGESDDENEFSDNDETDDDEDNGEDGEGDGKGEGKGGKGPKGGKGGPGSTKAGVSEKGTFDTLPNGLPNRALPKAGGPIGKISGTGSQRIRKNTMSGLARTLDDRIMQIDRYGDQFKGMPEDALGHVLYCA